MKWLNVFLSLLILCAGRNVAYCQDTSRCLRPPENGENLFPRCKHFFGSVEFLWWGVEEGALDYAIKMKRVGWAPVDKPFHFANGTLRNAHFHFHPGVRLCIGFYNAPSYWELFAQYTAFHPCDHDRAFKPQRADLFLNGTFPQLTDELFGNFLEAAKSEIDLDYQIVDVLFSRVFDPNPHLRMRLIAGVTGAFLEQKWKVKYLDSQDLTIVNKNCWCYNAGGLRLGITANWWWKWGLYLTGKASLAAYTGKYTNHSRITTNAVGGDNFDANAYVQNISYKDHRYVQHLQMMLGPSWQCVGPCINYELFIGYEVNGWFNLQETYHSGQGDASSTKKLGTQSSALAAHGLTVRLTVGF